MEIQLPLISTMMVIMKMPFLSTKEKENLVVFLMVLLISVLMKFKRMNLSLNLNPKP
jgi:hypothetical protein